MNPDDDDFSLAEAMGNELAILGNDFVENEYTPGLKTDDYDVGVYVQTVKDVDVGNVHVDNGLLMMVPDDSKPRKLLREYVYTRGATVVSDNIEDIATAVPEEEVFTGSVSASGGWENYYVMLVA
ncbi:hypothetical protein [Natronobacterium gregoryi]|uniref:Uncharacterized protein n=2 Tax=Natronobacterium gregoryi TaxID=44930 RepID=L0ALH6_NATGS|nr:hypothetical protein [Natronobacterium gregoryi]AFZ74621.1 hypothetical protein Natgr_3502 [Natronobacterium gregoryi SP2]ELY72558.1 hypothetical protein C490_03178 [Natronobacterium gregoryi SP2]PLK19806.1 hypothetical protein CYV19_12925 [Natronobacterium gregoryi SP2]SFJ30664.1 hypothetical protein SAMN05443661_12139 [Natronobacterium gregoryi]